MEVNVRNSAQFERNAEVATLSIRVADKYPALVRAQFEIPLGFGVTIPHYGNPTNHKALQVSCNTPNRPVFDWISILRSPGILSVGVIRYFNMSFSHSNNPSMAGSVSDISIHFIAEMSFTAGDKISFALPLFSFDGSRPLTLLSNIDALDPSLMWDPARQVLIVGVWKSLPGSTPTSMTVSGIRLPVEGIQLSQPTLTISTKAASGPMNSQPVTYCPAVFRIGSLESTLLTFNSRATRCVSKFGGFAYPGFETDRRFELPQLECDDVDLGSGRVATNTTMTFRFVPHMQLYATDTISLHLTNFTGSKPLIRFNGTNLTAIDDTPLNVTVTSDPHGLVSRASWSRATSTLTFTINRFHEASHSVVLVVDAVHGIKLPLKGLERNDPSLAVSSNAGKPKLSESCATQSPLV
jgi:hypothetical protein